MNVEDEATTKNSLLCTICFATSLVMGPGMFTVPGIALEIGGIEASIAAWLLTAVAILPFLFIFSRLQTLRPSSGIRDWVKEALGVGPARAVTSLLIGTMALLIPALAYAGAGFLSPLLNLGPQSIPWIGILATGVGLMLNIWGKAHISKLARFSFFALMGTFIYVVVMNWNLIGIAASRTSLSVKSGSFPSAGVVWQLSTLVFFAFIGWENMSVSADKVSGGARTLKRAYWLSYVFVVTLYMLLVMTVAGASLADSKALGTTSFTVLVQRLPLSGFFVVTSLLVILANSGAWIREAMQLFQSADEDEVVCHRRAVKSGMMFFLLSIFLVLMQHHGYISPAFLIRCANQNFVVIYALSLIAFARLEPNSFRWPVLAAAACSSVFLLSGIRWEFLYPVILIVGGFWHHRRTSMVSPGLSSFR